MKTPFENDIFALIWMAFKNIYPDKNCKCFWEPNIANPEDGECLGLTEFCQDSGEISVFVRPDISVADAAEIFAHELAHVAVGLEHDHDEQWEAAFDAIFDEYNRIGDEMYPVHEPMYVVSGKEYVRTEDHHDSD